MRRSLLTLSILFSIQNIYAESNEHDETIELKPMFVQATNEKKSEIIVLKNRIENAPTLGDALKHISGVQSTAFGPNSGAPMIRSLTGNRVGMYENGQSINGMNALSGDIAVPFDPLFSKSISVNKSSDVVQFGGQAIGGSVDIDSGLISKQMEEKDHSLDIVYKKGFNHFDAQGARLNFNNQNNLSTNIQFSTQKISAYDIPGRSKADVCNRKIFPLAGGVNSSLADVCQKDARIISTYNKGHQPFMNNAILEELEQDPSLFWDNYDGLESFKYTKDAVTERRGKKYINTPNPDYKPDTPEYVNEQRNKDVTPNYNKKLWNSDFKNENIAIGSTYFFDQGYIGLSLDRKKNEYGVPGFSLENKSFQENYDDRIPVRVKMDQTRYALESVYRQPVFGIDKIQFNASILQNKSGEYLGVKNANLYHFDTQFAELLVSHIPFKYLTGNLGLSLSTRDVTGSVTLRYLPDVKTDTQAFFIQEKLNLNWIDFEVGYRYEKLDHSIQSSDFKLARNAKNSKLEDKDFNLGSFITSIGLHPVDYLNFQLKYTQAERAPEINELYASNPHYSVMTQEEGDQGLKKEKLKSLEWMSQLSLENFQLTGTLYKMDFDDYLYLSHSGAAMRNRLPLKYWRQTDTEVKGFEVDASYRLDLSMYGNLTMSGFTDVVKNKAKQPDSLRQANDGVYLINMPSDRYGMSLAWEKSDWTTRLSSTYYAKQKNLGKNVSTEEALPTFNLVDLYISKKVKTKNANFDMFLNGSNLLDEEARPQNSPLKYIAPLPGRGFQLGVTMHI